MDDLQAFLDHIQDKARAARAFGSRLEIICIPDEFRRTLLESLNMASWTSGAVRYAEGGSALYIHGVKIVWLRNVPGYTTWARYQGGKHGDVVRRTKAA